MYIPSDFIYMVQIGAEVNLIGPVGKALSHLFMSNKPRFKPHVPNKDPEYNGCYTHTQATMTVVRNKPPVPQTSFLKVVKAEEPQLT